MVAPPGPAHPDERPMPAAQPTRTPTCVTTTSVNPRPDLPVNTTGQGLAGNSDGRRPWMDGKHADHRKTHRGTSTPPSAAVCACHGCYFGWYGVTDPPGHHWPTGGARGQGATAGGDRALHTRLSGIPDSARRTRIATLTRLTSPCSVWVRRSDEERGSA